jgi:ribonuclease Z
LGTGCPTVSTCRYGAATLVQCGDKNLLVDVGSGVTQRLVGAGLTGADIDALLITHIHSDHLVDLYQFIISSWHQNRAKPHKIFGPVGIKAFVEETMDVWKSERALRIKFEQRTSTAALDVEIIEFADETEIFPGTDCHVRPVLVAHQPVEPAYGFVFEAGGKKLVLSGDTRYCENLIAAAKDTDLLVHEVFVHGNFEISGTRSKQGLAAVESYHTLSSEVGKVAARANARALALTHIVPADTDRAALVTTAKKDFSGPVVVGEDLMCFDLMANTVRHGDVTFGF